MVDRVLVGIHVPLQGIASHACGHGEAVVDTGFDLRSFFIIIPRYQLQGIELVGGVVEAVDFVKGLQPGVAAALGHDAILSPRSERIIETFVGRSDGFLQWQGQTRLIEFRQIAHTKIGDVHNHPGITTCACGVRETTTVLKNEGWMSTGGCVDRVPVDGVMQVDIKVGDHRAPIDSHICGRRNKSLLHVLDLFNQRLLRRTASAGAQLYRAFIHHGGESEARMLFGLRHYRQRGFIAEGISKSVPIDDHTINAAADHVRDLTMDLRWILRVISHIHVARIAKPGHQMRVDLRICSRIQERMNIQFAGVASGNISIALGLERIRAAGVVGSLRAQGCGGNDFEASGC